MARRTKNSGPSRTSLGLATGLLGVALATAGCTSGSEATPSQKPETPAATAPANPAPAPSKAPEAQATLSPDAYNAFESTVRSIGRTVSCLLTDKRSGGAPMKDYYYGNIGHIAGQDGKTGTPDDAPQAVESFIQRTPKNGLLSFDATSNPDMGSIMVRGIILAPVGDPVFGGKTLDPTRAGKAMGNPGTESISGYVSVSQETGFDHAVGNAPGGLVYMSRDESRAATTEDLNTWSQGVQSALASLATSAGAPNCAPEPIPLLELPEQGSELPLHLQV